MPHLENVVVAGQGPIPLSDATAAWGKSAVKWADLKWIRQSWNGPIVVKGVLIADVARRAVDEGAAAIVVLNHGARQLDHVLPTIRALPEIVAAVGGKAEILMDGGFRRGSDIVKALCLGARAVLIGRSIRLRAGRGGTRRSDKGNPNPARRCGENAASVGLPVRAGIEYSYIDFPCESRKHQ